MKYELAAFLGFCAVITGCWWLSPAAALIVGGIAVGSWAVIGYLRGNAR